MLTVAIQAGGNSTRMGRDKALLPFLGKPLIARVLERLAPLADEILVITNRPQEYQFLGVPLYMDIVAGRGALGGLYTCLSVAHNALVAVVACDMPFVNRHLLAAMVDRLLSQDLDAVIPLTAQGMEPLHAVYRRETCLPAVREALEGGAWKLIAWLPAVRVLTLQPEEIAPFDPRGTAFWNLNTPEEFHQAEQLAREWEKEDSHA
jgi:molybdopterin-guanine dinucleotide biosynthesis protein A